MKEIIYLDTNLMNSMLAQLDEGLIKSFSLEQSDQETEGEVSQSERGKKAGLSAGITADTGIFPGGSAKLRATLGGSGNESESFSRTILEGQKDILNKAFHDYALDLLTEKLSENELLVEDGNLEEGDLHLGESTYRFYDFDLIKRSTDPILMEKFMLIEANGLGISLKKAKAIIANRNPSAQDRRQKEDAQKVLDAHETVKPIIETFDNMNNLSEYASKLLDNLIIIKPNNKIGLMKKEYLRESVESLTFRTDKSRKVKYLVRVIGRKEFIHDGVNGPSFESNDLDTIPNMMLDVILGSFNIIEKGDLLVTPIAIYYE